MAILLASLIMLFLVCAFFAGKTIEKYWMPVASVQDIKVTRLDNYFISVSGVMKKHRDCDFDALRWFQGDRQGKAVPINLVFKEPNKIRSPGIEVFGPWELKLSKPYKIEDTYATAWHYCRVFGIELPWRSETVFYN